jgi:hypothetical protein
MEEFIGQLERNGAGKSIDNGPVFRPRRGTFTSARRRRSPPITYTRKRPSVDVRDSELLAERACR